MTDSTKASILLGALILAALAGGTYGVLQSQGKAAALRRAAVAEGEANAAQQAKAQAQADRAAADKVAEQRGQRVADLQEALARRPRPAPAEPVPDDAPMAVVVAGLQQLGLHPQTLGEGLALNLPDGRTTLAWGREFLRVPGLEDRIIALQDLSRARGDQVAAKDQQLAAADRSLAASEAESFALRRQAAALQRAVDLTPRWRPTSAGIIAGLDESGTRRFGAYLTHSWGPIEVGALYLNRNAGVMAGIRF